MKAFLDDDFLLNGETAKRLYHDYAKDLPIIDYHSHLPPNEIADNINFNNLTHAWLYGDHYKWRAMRANSVNEEYVTGNAGDEEKFMQWAGTVPYTLRNPLYHWTHLELRRYFGVEKTEFCFTNHKGGLTLLLPKQCNPACHVTIRKGQ